MENKTNGLIRGEKEFLESLQKDDFTELRLKAYEQWKNSAAPTTRNEYWKYTRLAPMLKKSYSIVRNTEEFNNHFLRSLDFYNLVFINGVFIPNASDQIDRESILISDLITVKRDHPEMLKGMISEQDPEDYFSLLNDAFHQNGPFIHLDKNALLDKPVRIVHISKGTDRLVNIKGFVRADSGATINIIETWDQENASENLVNSRMDISVAENASVEMIKIQSMSENNLICQDFAEQKRDGRFTIHTITTDGKLVRNNLNIKLLGENAESNLNGLYLARGSEHIDNHTTIHHKAPNCVSNELYKGIAGDKSKTVFNGKVIVYRDAQKTNAFQSNANILLSDEAEIYSKPELEIYADDVKCSHGSTTGQLDEEALFYLESRGIGRERARNLLLYAFAREVLDRIPIEELRKKIVDYLGDRYKVNVNA